MRSLQLLRVTVLFAIAVLATAQVAEAQDQAVDQQASWPVLVSYSLPKDHLTLHEPVVLVFTAANKTRYPIQLDLGQDRQGQFSFAVVDPNGTRHQLPLYLREGLSDPGIFSVEPGHTYSQKLVLNQWYSFSVPGRYELEGHLARPIVIGGGIGQQTDRGFRFTLDIGPRDEAALTETCESLVKEIEGPDGQDAADAALALSYVDDPLAEPYLRSVLFKRSELEPVLLKGLGRIGDGRSVSSLAEAAASDDDEVKEWAIMALYDIGQRTNDPQVREEINRILANP
ncbi:MAG TPA: HEAT repeat domain-containing protein [Acidobacteriaceae bacterium]|jgi:hypothetical protein|nr:HEAT repeat domain-containing protein [Acidobacteriaceae bacterium]